MEKYIGSSMHYGGIEEGGWAEFLAEFLQVSFYQSIFFCTCNEQETKV